MTPEAKVKKKVTGVLKRLGIYYFFPLSGGFGRGGVPDIIGCIRGRFLAIECKAGDNVPTALQDAQINKIIAAGGLMFLINEDKVAFLEKYLVEYLNDDRS